MRGQMNYIGAGIFGFGILLLAEGGDLLVGSYLVWIGSLIHLGSIKFGLDF